MRLKVRNSAIKSELLIFFSPLQALKVKKSAIKVKLYIDNSLSSWYNTNGQKQRRKGTFFMSKSNYRKLESYGDLPSDLAIREENALTDERKIAIRKSNELIRKFTAKMTVSQFRLANYIIGIAYTQSDTLELKFDVKRYCEVCGIDYKSGKNYNQIKADIKKLSDRSLWVEAFGDPNTEVLVRLINKSWVYSRSGIVKIRLDEDVKQYITALFKQYQEKGKLYTSYAFLYTLPMRSVYSMRLYELLKSWATEQSEYNERWEYIDVLKELLDVDYERYQDFRRFVLDKAINEINEYTDLNVSYEPIKEGRNYTRINFYIQRKSPETLLKIQNEINKYLNFGRDDERAQRRAAKQIIEISSDDLTANADGQTTFSGCEGMPEPL